MYLKGSHVKLSKLRCISVPEIVFIIANSADPEKMPPFAAFHKSLHCLQKYLLTSIQNEKG